MPLLSLLSKRPVEFAIFEACQRAGSGSGKTAVAAAPFFGGAMAGVVSSCIGCPFNVVIVQMQSTTRLGDGGYRNVVEAAKTVWKTRGLLGFYRGVQATLIMQVPGCAFYLGMYGTLREALPKRRWTPAAAGCLSSMAMWTVLLPLDTVKTLTQAHSFIPPGGGGGSALASAPPRWLEIFWGVVKSRGWRGLWDGWGPILWRAGPVSATSMLAYETAREFVNLSNRG